MGAEDFQYVGGGTAQAFGWWRIAHSQPGIELVAGDAFVITKDTPQARALLKYVATAEAQDIWVKRGGGKIAINKQVSLNDYPDAISKSIAQVVVDTKIARYDAGDLMPSDMQQAYWSAALKFATDQSKLDSILADLDKIQATAYENLSIIPSELDMCGAEVEMSRLENHLQRFKVTLKTQIISQNFIPSEPVNFSNTAKVRTTINGFLKEPIVFILKN